MSYFEPQNQQLPNNFAQTVMELEMQLQFQQSSTIQVVQQLNDLYRIAIEYYIHTDIRKLQHFQRKLTSLLTHPNTLQAIQNKQAKKELSKKSETVGSYNKCLKNQLNKFNSQSNILVKSMLQGSQIKVKMSNKIISQNIQNQEQLLRRRLLSRGQSINKSTCLR